MGLDRSRGQIQYFRYFFGGFAVFYQIGDFDFFGRQVQQSAGQMAGKRRDNIVQAGLKDA